MGPRARCRLRKREQKTTTSDLSIRALSARITVMGQWPTTEDRRFFDAIRHRRWPARPAASQHIGASIPSVIGMAVRSRPFNNAGPRGVHGYALAACVTDVIVSVAPRRRRHGDHRGYRQPRWAPPRFLVVVAATRSTSWRQLLIGVRQSCLTAYHLCEWGGSNMSGGVGLKEAPAHRRRVETILQLYVSLNSLGERPRRTVIFEGVMVRCVASKDDVKSVKPGLRDAASASRSSRTSRWATIEGYQIKEVERTE